MGTPMTLDSFQLVARSMVHQFNAIQYSCELTVK